MKKLSQVIKMLVVALAMGIVFCSCNVAGGSGAYDAQSSNASKSGITGNDSGAPAKPVSFSIIIPEINVSVSGADRARQSDSGTTAITAEATEGARLMWYVNGMFQEDQTGPVFELSCAYPGAYDVTCVAVSEDGTLAKSASMCVVVTR